jgi:tetratricopeptide (TPR) repeat protein
MREKKSPEVSPTPASAGGEFSAPLPAQSATQGERADPALVSEEAGKGPISNQETVGGQPPKQITDDKSQRTDSPSSALISPFSDNAIPIPVKERKFSPLQIALVSAVILSAALLTYSLVWSPTAGKTPMSADAAQLPATPLAEKTNKPSEQKEVNQPVIQPDDTQVEQTEPLSLQLSESYYTAKDYDKAYNAYERLQQTVPTQDFDLVKDFLRLRMALCLEKKADFDKANQMFKIICESRSVAIRAIANYHTSLLEMNSGQYLKARTRAYKTISLTGLLAFDCEWALALEKDCSFLAAEAITRQILSLCDADKELPEQLWSHLPEKDPLTGLDETRLKAVLNSGNEQLSRGLLAPQVKAVESSPGAVGLKRWTVICNGPGIEELMARFAANASLDIKWEQHTNGAAKNDNQTVGWNRPVVLYMPQATAQQAAITAAGSVGLLAGLDDPNFITITDPAVYSSLSEHILILDEHAIWLWRKLLLTYNDDSRIANVHFALALLQSQKEKVAEAIAEYKIVANRYSRTPLSPFALLRSSRLKTGLRDYAGASSDLKQLIVQYPDNELIGQAHLDLAETTMKSGLYDQACSLYKKAYTLGSSVESRREAAFGAGRCLYQTKDYESAIKWLILYIEPTGTQQNTAQNVAKQQSADNAKIYTTYFLLGKANMALGNLQQACVALDRSVRRASISEEYVEAISALVETQIKQENFVAALDTIENVRAWPFSQEQSTQLLLLKSKVMRSIGLTDKAITVLVDRTQYLTDVGLKANMTLELARCYVAMQNLELARTHFTEVLSMVEAGPVAQQASLELAEVCLKLDDHKQTILICNQLLGSSASEQIKQEASKIIASAYSSQLEYDKAAVALMSAASFADGETSPKGGTAPGLTDKTKPNTEKK